VPEKPAGLSPAAEAFWDRTVPRLVQAGAVGEVDGFALQAAAEAWSLYRAALTAAAAEPTSKVARAAVVAYLGLWLTLAGRVGLTPADRQRLQLDLADDPADLDPLEMLLRTAPRREGQAGGAGGDPGPGEG
jgi:phage terminase small subunit